MVLKKKDIVEINNETNKLILAEAEARVDAALKEYKGQAILVLDKDVNIPYYLREHFLRKYRDAGWKASWSDNQFDGAWYRFE